MTLFLGLMDKDQDESSNIIILDSPERETYEIEDSELEECLKSIEKFENGASVHDDSLNDAFLESFLSDYDSKNFENSAITDTERTMNQATIENENVNLSNNAKKYSENDTVSCEEKKDINHFSNMNNISEKPLPENINNKCKVSKSNFQNNTDLSPVPSLSTLVNDVNMNSNMNNISENPLSEKINNKCKVKVISNFQNNTDLSLVPSLSTLVNDVNMNSLSLSCVKSENEKTAKKIRNLSSKHKCALRKIQKLQKKTKRLQTRIIKLEQKQYWSPSLKLQIKKMITSEITPGGVIFFIFGVIF